MPNAPALVGRGVSVAVTGTHATDADTNAERDFIVAELRNNRVIGDASEIQAGQHIEHVNHYVTDGEIAVANL